MNAVAMARGATPLRRGGRWLAVAALCLLAAPWPASAATRSPGDESPFTAPPAGNELPAAVTAVTRRQGLPAFSQPFDPVRLRREDKGFPATTPRNLARWLRLSAPACHLIRPVTGARLVLTSGYHDPDVMVSRLEMGLRQWSTLTPAQRLGTSLLFLLLENDRVGRGLVGDGPTTNLR